jgi:hypothetical protein
MGIWNTKFRSPALVAGLVAICVAANPALAAEKQIKKSEGVRGSVGFTSGALIGGAAAGPIGMVVGAGVGAIMGERSQKKSAALAQRRAEAALLAGQVETLNVSLSHIEGKAGQVGATVQFRIQNVRVRISGYADARGDEALNLSLSQERAEMVARELEKAGVPKERMTVEAMGERFASGDAPADDQAFERCVEIRFESGAALASNQ